MKAFVAFPILLIFAVLLTVFLIYPVNQNLNNSVQPVETQTNIKSLAELRDSAIVEFTVTERSDINISLEVAKSDNKKAYGLMNREELAEDSGMIFIYDDESILSFWMKDTLIPLDIIFLDSNLKILNIEEAKANQTTERYRSAKPAQYVVEMNKGWSRENGVKEGDVFEVVE